MTAYLNRVGAGFDGSGGDDTDTGGGDQFDVNPGLRMKCAQVVDQLREIFDAVDVVVRRRRNQRRARLRVAQSRDVIDDLLCGELATFPWLRPLRHLDLQLAGGSEVRRCDA